MRILASNPDTIGDLVLRQPLYRALVDAGHELTLIVRASVEPVVPLVAPGARILVLPGEVYGDVDSQWQTFEALACEARESRPDLLLIAPYQWTRFEERLAESLRSNPGSPVVVAGMNGHLYAGDPHAGAVPASTLALDRIATVATDLPEAEKNAALAEMLGVRVPSVDPVLSPPTEAIEEARKILAERALEPGGYWIACVTGTVHVPIKAWPTDRWAAVLSDWANRYGRRFLFIGTPDERDRVERVQAEMGTAAGATAIWMEPGGSIATLAALASLSLGYVGHDTGPMHIAAAVGKPVLALFGGGHGMRFAPRATPAIAMSVAVPCAGCGWACSFETAHCVQELSTGVVTQAIDDFENGRVTGREIRLFDLPPHTRDQMTRYAGNLARDRLRELGTTRSKLTSASVKAAHADELAEQLIALRSEAAELHSAVSARTADAELLVRQLQDRERTTLELREAIELANHQTRTEAAARAAEVGALREQLGVAQKELEALRQRVAELTAPAVAPIAPPRKSWREIAVDLVCGQRHYTPRYSPSPMPKILVVTRVGGADDDADVRATLDSVLAERYPHLAYVLVAEAVDQDRLDGYRDRVDAILPATAEPFGAVAEAFARSDADLIAWLDVGQRYEPGALFRIGEYFRDHSLAFAAVFEQTVEQQGWRSALKPRRVDVRQLRLPAEERGDAHIVFRREAVNLLGPLNPAKGYAAGWDLTIRVARRYGIRLGRGHSICTNADVLRNTSPEAEQAIAADFAKAASEFEASFGLAGRVRCAALTVLHRLLDLRKSLRLKGLGDPWVSGPPAEGFAPATGAADTAMPTSPLTHQPADRLLFSAPDVTTADQSLYRVYADAENGVAVSYPTADGPTLDRLHDERGRRSGSSVVPPKVRQASPFVGYTGGPRWVRWLSALPTPYWRLSRRSAGAESPAERMVGLTSSAIRANDASARVLVVGCFNGSILDDLKRRTRWQLVGIETNEAAVDAARGRGHTVWACSPQDAFMTLPDGDVFDLILVPAMLEHWQDPAWVLRRLTRILTPSGRIVLRTPNLDSQLLERFGPTWWHWQLPYHRTLFTRKGLKSLAAMCDLKLVRMKTVTDAYTAAASVQLNALGLAGVVPEGSAFSREIATRGAKLAGWSRMLWDRVGRGDEMWVMLQPM